jgi:hypothetical protein
MSAQDLEMEIEVRPATKNDLCMHTQNTRKLCQEKALNLIKCTLK